MEEAQGQRRRNTWRFREERASCHPARQDSSRIRVHSAGESVVEDNKLCCLALGSPTVTFVSVDTARYKNGGYFVLVNLNNELSPRVAARSIRCVCTTDAAGSFCGNNYLGLNNTLKTLLSTLMYMTIVPKLM